MITLDFETKSHADLLKVGSWNYSLHPTTEIITCSYGIGDAEPQRWWPGKELTGKQGWVGETLSFFDIPHDLYKLILRGELLEAHHAAFEKAIWINICTPDFGWPEFDPKVWRDTMAVAAYYAMPQGLDKLCKAIGLPGKNPKGGRLITKYSKLHLKTAKSEIPADDLEDFREYCDDDVRQEEDVSDYLGDLPEEELAVWHLDQKINMRGIPLDAESLADAMAVVTDRAGILRREFLSIVGYNPTQTEKVKDWFHAHGAPMENMQADYIEEVLEGKKDFAVKGKARKALIIRNKFNKASVKKLNAMLRNMDDKGRARFQLRYHGAAPGRWTGTGFQPLNMNKGFEDIDPNQLIKDISYRDARWLDVMYGDAMDAISKATRHHIKAKKGHRLIAGDFVSIEAVLLACMAGEEWKVDAFTRGDPIYELMGCKIHNLPEEAVALAKRDKKAFKEQYYDERFDGKTGELAFGYQGNLGAWLKFDSSGRHSNERIKEICRAWRAEHPMIVDYWYDLEFAAKEAIDNPGEEFPVRIVSFKIIDEWLSMKLPNGKRIWYYDPQIRLGMPVWHRPNGFDLEDEDTYEYEDCANGSCSCTPRRQITYMSQKTGKWQRVNTYGGKLCENATQATSREVLVPAMFRVEEARYPIILDVYDEIVAEVPNGFGDIEEFKELMAICPGEWAEGWPIRVDAWEGARYRK